MIHFVDLAADRWAAAADGDAPVPFQLLTPAQWDAARNTRPTGLPTGIVLANDHEVQTLRDDLPRFALIVLQFPKWSDGRAYSQARLLRARLRYPGEVRAVGQVLVDMMLPLVRTGFSSALLREDQDEQAARRALSFFDGLLPARGGAQAAYYQGDVRDPRPLFLREAA